MKMVGHRTADGRGRAIGNLGRHGPAIAALLAMSERLVIGRLTIVLPDGSQRVVEGENPGPAATIVLRNGRIMRRYMTGGAVGFAESFLDGDWDSPDLSTLLELLDRNQDAWGTSYYGSTLNRAIRRLQHAFRTNTKHGSRRNIHAHYDLGNDFFASWLDPTMLYSAAAFVDGTKELAEAQLAKCRRLLKMIGAGPGQRLLEIGSGWGTFAILAAKEYGMKVTSLTISQEQLTYARRRVAEEGLNEQVEIRFQDYRDVEGQFDKIASIEMFEAVGESYWRTFFDKLRACLTPDGAAGLQIITIADDHFSEYRRTPDFIQRYIFPGGMLPSPSILKSVSRSAGLQETDSITFGGDYARTLGLWRERFDLAWSSIVERGFDERFRRIWTYYLAYCEAGFRTGSIDVVQTVMRPSQG
ncbi:cyclopropane-fatty-acyl-phospholipid synthase [Arboricoccus pini]|uniref:Cyclopropane-fatty-acyl-phospholipid synthase n=2 Tax=Arboricoccus pini TaxID=1963835 RepID=A0A212R2M5_9PROT|nr:cyclopropane-fatty-acyl-phospholipid synthase [Arboricoccus pini]